MKSVLRLLPVLACLALSHLAVAAEGLVFGDNLETALTEAQASNKLVMIDLKAEWCGPCKLLDRTTWADESVKSALRDRAVAVKIDVDERRDIAMKFAVHSLPTVVFLDSKGLEVGRFIGYRDAEDFLEELKKLD